MDVLQIGYTITEVVQLCPCRLEKVMNKCQLSVFLCELIEPFNFQRFPAQRCSLGCLGWVSCLPGAPNCKEGKYRTRINVRNVPHLPNQGQEFDYRIPLFLLAQLCILVLVQCITREGTLNFHLGIGMWLEGPEQRSLNRPLKCSHVNWILVQFGLGNLLANFDCSLGA